MLCMITECILKSYRLLTFYLILICFLFSLCCVVVINDANLGLVFNGRCECFMLSLAVRLRLFDVDRIRNVCGICSMNE